MTQNPVSVVIPGYSAGLNDDVIPATNNAGGASISDMRTDGLPPVVWMFIFLVVGYVGLRMLLED